MPIDPPADRPGREAEIDGERHARIVGALRSCIAAHGPITPEWIGSAAKRIAGLFAALEQENERLQVTRNDAVQQEANLIMEVSTLRAELDAILAVSEVAGEVSYGTTSVASAVRSALHRVAAERDELKQETDDYDRLIDKLGKLLSGVAIALNGHEPPLTKWSWHDLPEKATAVVAEHERLKAAVRAYLDAEEGQGYQAEQELLAALASAPKEPSRDKKE